MSVKNSQGTHDPRSGATRVVGRTVCLGVAASEAVLIAFVVVTQQSAWGSEKVVIGAIFFALLLGVFWQISSLLLTQTSSEPPVLQSRFALTIAIFGVGVGLSTLILNLLGGPHALLAPWGLIAQLVLIAWAQRMEKEKSRTKF